jgi:hypothetical protein
MENTNAISQKWVKATPFAHLNFSIYWDAECTAIDFKLGMRAFFNRLKKGPLSTDDYFVEQVKVKHLPAFVEAPMNIAESAERMRSVGLVGVSIRFEKTQEVDPYLHAGFIRIMATGEGNYVYRNHNLTYLSLPYTLDALGIKVSDQFIPFVAEYQKEERDDLIWPIAEVRQGIIQPFDILYDARYREDLLQIAREYHQ